MRLDAIEQVSSDAATSALQNADVTTRPASEVDAVRTAASRPSQDRPRLRELMGGWTWQIDPDDRRPPPSDAERDSISTKRQLTRAFAWARILIG